MLRVRSLSAIVVLLAVLTSAALAQVNMAWVRRYDGGGDVDIGSAIGVDGTGNVYVTGTSHDGVGYSGTVTIKYDSQGSQQWTRRFGCCGGYYPDMFVDAPGNVYVALTDTSGNLDCVTLKYDTRGVQQWRACYNGPANGGDVASAIAVDQLGNVYVTGSSEGTAWGPDFVTVKYDASGGQQWAVRYSGPDSSWDAPGAISVDDAGSVFVTGYSYTFGSPGEYAMVTVKYDSRGIQQWLVRYTASGGSSGRDVVADGNGGAYVAGSDGGDFVTLKYDASGARRWVARVTDGGATAIALDATGSICVTGSGGSGYLTAKYSPSGTWQWIARYRGPAMRGSAYDISVDPQGNVCVTGQSYGSSLVGNYATVKYSPSGVQQWVARYEGPGRGYDAALAIASDASANVYVTGSVFCSSVDGEDRDYCTIKYTQNTQTKPWTVLAYMDGDNDLEGCGIGDIDEMESAIDPSLYNVVVQFDRTPGWSSASGDWTGTRRYLVAPGTIADSIESPMVEDCGELNMGDGNTLVDFAKWGMSNYPARRYCLVIWDHGEGWRLRDVMHGLCQDDTDNDSIGVAEGELEAALANIRSSLRRNIDLLCFDACLMAMAEVDYTCRSYANVAVHSELPIPGDGFPYDAILRDLNDEPGVLARPLARKIVGRYLDSYKEGGSQHDGSSVTLSSFDMEPGFAARLLSSAINDFAAKLILAGGRELPLIKVAWAVTQDFGIGLYHNDLYDFADEVDKCNIGGAGSPLDKSAQALKAVFRQGRQYGYLYEGHYSDPEDLTVDDAHGIAVYYPVTLVPPDYARLPFAKQTLWYNFIRGDVELPAVPLLGITGARLQTAASGARLSSASTLALELTNYCRDTATQVHVSIRTDDPHVGVLSGGPISFPDIVPLASARSESVFTLTFSDSMPSDHRFVVWVELTAAGGCSIEVALPLAASEVLGEAGWSPLAPMPLTPSGKSVKDGAWLTYDVVRERVFAAKGNKTTDFYEYSPADDVWRQLGAIPLGMENKPPYKGAAACADPLGVVYAAKGNNTLGFFRYDVTKDSWRQLADVPLGTSGKKVKGGCDLAYVAGDTDYVYLLKGYRDEFWRYNVARDSWCELAPAPAPKWDKGSWLALVLDPEPRLYAHQAKYHGFYAYDLGTQSWGGSLGGMPLVGQSGKSKKSKDGGSAASVDNAFFALKGGNTQEFWAFSAPNGPWMELDTIPRVEPGGSKKKVKAGGDIAAVVPDRLLYALKGNKTNTLWRYTLGPGILSDSRSGVMALARNRPCEFVLYPNAPNPFRVTTSIRYALPIEGPVSLKIFDVAGRTVKTLVDMKQRPGRYSLRWDGDDNRGRTVGNGVYFCKLRAGAQQMTRKLVLQR